MKFKTTFRLLCLTQMVLLSISMLDVHAASESSSCTDYYSAYQSAVDAYNTTNETLQSVNVVVAKKTGVNVPDEWKHLEDEYDSDPNGFYKTLEGMGVALPGSVSGPLSLAQFAELRGAKTDATTAYDSAVEALEAAEKALADCQGVTIVTIWCERGASCQTPPGEQGRPKAHYVFDCPDQIKGSLGIKADCPGTWWSCDGVNHCPRSADHRVVGPCPDGEPKHEYASGSPGGHGQRVVCGAVGATSKKPDGMVVKQVCKDLVWKCSPHGSHTWSKVEFKAGLGSGSGYVCANASCSLSGSRSSGSSHLPGGTDADQMALASRAYDALHWNHSIALGIGTAATGASAAATPVLSYEHQRVCAGGHKYWSCDSSAVEIHAPRTCSRPGCGETFSNCTNFMDSCPVSAFHAKFGFGGSTLNPENTDALLVACGNTNSGEGACAYGGQTASVNAHQTTCLAGHTYWSCNAKAVVTHASHTAPLVACGNTNTGAGACSSGGQAATATAHQTTCAAGHTYWSCNVNAVKTHGTHTAPEIPATDPPSTDPVTPPPPETGGVACGNPNTGPGACSAGGTAPSTYAHQTTCLAGHTYWSCNSNAVETHGTHTAPETPATDPPSTEPPSTEPVSPPTGDVTCGNPNTGPGACSAGGTAPSTYAHQTTCLANHTYWSCNANAVVTHGTHTAPAPVDPEPQPPIQNPAPVVCPADSWTGCGGTVSHATTCAANHTYYTCNSSAVDTHSKHTAPSPDPPPEPAPAPVVCPADAWTGCGGTVSHATTCLAGHEYYTCNSSAVDTHSKHTAPSPDPPPDPEPPPPPPPPPPEPEPPPDDGDDEEEEDSSGKCPADAWTGCGGSAGDHDAVCAAGHSYYTCNSKAVKTHSKH